MINNSRNQQFRIIGQSEETVYGNIKPFYIKQYRDISKYLPMLKNSCNKNKNDLLALAIKTIDNKDDIAEFKELVKDKEYVFFLKNNVFQIKNNLLELLKLVVDEDNVDKVVKKVLKNDEQWNRFRKTILEINGFDIDDVEVERPKSDKELMYEMANEVMKEKKGQTVDFHAIYTSIVVKSGLTPNQINDLTIFQFFSVYRRIQKFMDYNTTTLYKTVDSKGNIKVVPWSKADEVVKKNDDKMVTLRHLTSKVNIADVNLNDKDNQEVITNER